MTSILISINPKWCELIANGNKTIEVRKTRPKIETPFNCYIYCTRNARDLDKLQVLNEQRRQEYRGLTAVCANLAERPDYHYCGNGKVIGEFVCDCITPLYNVCTDDWSLLRGGLHEIEKQLVGMACLTEEELHEYANGKYCFAWHISDIKIYGKPKELCDFHHCGVNYHFNPAVTRPPQSWCYVENAEMSS